MDHGDRSRLEGRGNSDDDDDNGLGRQAKAVLFTLLKSKLKSTVN